MDWAEACRLTSLSASPRWTAASTTTGTIRFHGMHPRQFGSQSSSVFKSSWTIGLFLDFYFAYGHTYIHTYRLVHTYIYVSTYHTIGHFGAVA